MLPQKIAFGSIHVMARPLAEQRAEGAHFKPHGLQRRSARRSIA
jgi:hypothetical protein